MKKMKVKLLTGRSSSEGSNAPGDSILLPVKEAINLVNSNQAEPSSKKDYEAAVSEIEAEEAVEQDKQAEIEAISNKEHIETELNGLYTDVVLKEAALNGVVLESEQILEMVEELKRRILPGEGETKTLWQKFTGK